MNISKAEYSTTGRSFFTFLKSFFIPPFPSIGGWFQGTGRDGSHALGVAEGASFLLLVFIAVPLKRIGGEPALVRALGPVHGALVVLYATSALLAARSLGWGWKRTLIALGAAVVPFGTFALNRRAQREAVGAKA